DGAIAFAGEPESPPADGDALSLPHAVRLALSHDPRVRAALAKVRVAEAEANQALLLPNPILTLDVRYPFSHGSNTVFEPSLAAGTWRLDAVEADATDAGAAESGDERAWVEAALARRPEVGAARWELAALGDDYAAASLPPLSGGEIGAHAERDPDWRLGPSA